MRSRAVRGSAWTLLSFGIAEPLRFAANLVLTRLLVPELFGLMQIVNAISRGLVMVSDTGVRTYLIQSDEAHEDGFLDTAWTIQVFRGILLFVLMLALGYPVAVFFEDSRLMFLVPMVGLTSLFTGFMSVSFLTLQKRMNLGLVTAVEVSGQVVTVISMVTWALIDPSVWALAGGGVIGSIVKLVLSYVLLPRRSHRLHFDRAIGRRMFTFGKWITIATALTFFAMHADRFILGKLATLAQVGVYGLALSLVQMGRDLTQRLSARVLLPVLSEIKNAARDVYRSKIDRFRRRVMFLAAVPISLVAVFGDFLVLALYDDRWIEAGAVLRVLALGLWPFLMTITMSRALVAIGHPQYNAYGSLLRFVVIGIALPIGFIEHGLVGAGIAVACSDIPLYFATVVGRLRHSLGGFLTDLFATTFFLALLGVLMLLR